MEVVCGIKGEGRTGKIGILWWFSVSLYEYLECCGGKLTQQQPEGVVARQGAACPPPSKAEGTPSSPDARMADMVEKSGASVYPT